MQKNIFKAALTAIALVAASSASALTIDFTTFSGNASLASGTYIGGGQSTTATAGSTLIGAQNPLVKEATSPGATSADPGYYRGLGATVTGNADGSLNAGEFLRFTIPAGFAVESVTVTQAGSGGQNFGMFVDGGNVGGGSVSALNNVGTDGRTTVLATPTAGSLFVIQSDLGNSGGVWVNSLELTSLTTMPLPAGVVLLGGGLAIGGFAARRKAKKAA